MQKLLIVACILLALGLTDAYADTLRLMDGRDIAGTMIGADPRQVRFMRDDGPKN